MSVQIQHDKSRLLRAWFEFIREKKNNGSKFVTGEIVRDILQF